MVFFCLGLQRANTPGYMTFEIIFGVLCEHDTATSQTDVHTDRTLAVAIDKIAYKR